MKKDIIAKRFIAMGMLGLVALLVPAGAVRAESMNSENSVHITASNKMPQIKAKADQAIAKRIESLNRLITKINGMEKLPADAKATYVAKAQTNISNLTTLRVKIAADTDLAVLKADAASITKAYRIYMLVIPQVRIMANADRLNVAGNEATTNATSLQTRINTAASAGKDITSLNAQLVSMNAKIAQAHTNADQSKAAVTSLVPDNGNETMIASNKAALENGKKLAQSASSSLKSAREDARSINKSLKMLGF
jgi:hypothetical protein